MALLVGSIFFNLNSNQASIQDRIGVLFFMMTSSGFSQFAALNLFMEGRNLFNRERASGLYCTSAYYCAKSLSDFSTVTVFPVIYACMAYWMVGLHPTTECFGIFMLTLMLFALTMSSFFLAVGAACPSIVVASLVAPLFMVILMLFAGFYINVESIPVYYRWIPVISPFKYTYETLMKNEFLGLTFTCDDYEKINGTCPVQTGAVLLERMGMLDVNIWQHIIILAGCIVLLRIAAYIFLRFLYKEKA